MTADRATTATDGPTDADGRRRRPPPRPPSGERPPTVAEADEAGRGPDEATRPPPPPRSLDEDEFLGRRPRPKAESPYDRPGKWFVLHTQSGYENKVRQNLEARTKSMNMEERIHEIVIPIEDVTEIRNGKKVVVQKKMFPGYLLVRCSLDDDSWYVIRNTPGVTGFVGAGNKPSPLPRKDVEKFLTVKTGDGGRGARSAPSPASSTSSRDGARQGRPVRGLLRRDRRDQRGAPQDEGARQHLRPRDPRRARVLPGRQAVASRGRRRRVAPRARCTTTVRPPGRVRAVAARAVARRRLALQES